MLLSLDSGVSALEQFQQQLNVIANNIANVNTVGFKAADVDFADTLSQTIGSNAAGSMQVGTGVTTSSITNDFSTPGSLNATGRQTDLAINGNGFFVVKDPTSGATYVTQDGTFSIDSSGYLVTSSGLRVQGCVRRHSVSDRHRHAEHGEFHDQLQRHDRDHDVRRDDGRCHAAATSRSKISPVRISWSKWAEIFIPRRPPPAV